MTVLETAATAAETLADLLDRLGEVSPKRILLQPPLGTATEADLIRVNHGKYRLRELVDGVLVEKAEGLRESLLAGALIARLRAFIVPRNRGVVSVPDGMMRLFPGLVRLPDVAYIAWERFPDRCIPLDPIPDVAPDLAVEILSESNTRKEMARKRREYFGAGARLVWEIDPGPRTVTVYTDPEAALVLQENDRLDGGDVLPGFALPLQDLFAELDRRGG